MYVYLLSCVQTYVCICVYLILENHFLILVVILCPNGRNNRFCVCHKPPLRFIPPYFFQNGFNKYQSAGCKNSLLALREYILLNI